MDLTSLFNWIFGIIGLYLLLGLVFALWMITGRIKKLDPAADGGTIGFRLLIIPGMAVFWSLFLKRLLGGVSQPPVETNSHRRAAAEGKGGEA